MRKNTAEKIVTETIFKKEIDSVRSDFKVSFNRMSYTIMSFDSRLTHVEETMATKSDVNVILNRIDDFALEVRNFNRKELVQDFRINELEPKVDDHEKRISHLENK